MRVKKKKSPRFLLIKNLSLFIKRMKLPLDFAYKVFSSCFSAAQWNVCQNTGLQPVGGNLPFTVSIGCPNPLKQGKHSTATEKYWWKGESHHWCGKKNIGKKNREQSGCMNSIVKTVLTNLGGKEGGMNNSQWFSNKKKQIPIKDISEYSGGKGLKISN